DQEVPGMSTMVDSVRDPLVGAVARVPLPIRAKQLVGTFAVAALLALVAVLGLVALGQSNSRGAELRRLQQQGAFEQLVLTDATRLEQLLDVRLGRLYDLNDAPRPSEEPDIPHFSTRSYQRGFLSSLDQRIGGEFSQLCLDAGVRRLEFVEGGNYYCGQPSLPPRLPLTLYSVAPSLFAKIASRNTQQLFIGVSGSSGTPQAPYQSRFVRSAGVAASFAAELDILTRQTQARATALAATNRSSYNRSRNLLIA